jgi:hypothetical protein
LRRASLIRQVYGGERPADAHVEEQFFNRLLLPTGVFKTTAARRLDDLNEMVVDLLPDARPLELMDVAVSSGVTTVEWSAQLTSAGIDHRVVAGDLHTKAVWVRLGWTDVVLESRTGRPIYVDLAGRGVHTGGDGVLRRLVAGAVAQVARGRARRGRATEIALVSPRVHDLPAITVIEDDIFSERQELTARFHALRAANILNRGYFDDAQLTRALANLRRRLRPGGLLVVCRTHEDGTNHGTAFRLGHNECAAVGRVGDGSEIEDLVSRAVSA